jgi:hypothetical protein
LAVPLEGISELKPAPEEWFFRYDAETSTLDVLVSLEDQHLLVGAVPLAQEQSKGQVIWEKFSSSVTQLFSKLFEVVDNLLMAVWNLAENLLMAVGNIAGHLLVGWLDGDGPAPWEWGDDDDDDDDDRERSGLIFPAHRDS